MEVGLNYQVSMTINNFVVNVIVALFYITFTILVRDLLSLVPPTAALAGFTYITYRAFCPHGRPAPSKRINHIILKSNPKVVDTVDIENIDEKAVFCRCWKSKNV